MALSAACGGVAAARNNQLLSGSENGGRTAAILTSFITTCKRLQINPFTYLRDVFDRISPHPVNRLDELPPITGKPLKTPPIASLPDPPQLKIRANLHLCLPNGYVGS